MKLIDILNALRSTSLLGAVPNQVIQREDSAFAYRTRSKGPDSLRLCTRQARRLLEVDAQRLALGAPGRDGTRRRSDSTP